MIVLETDRLILRRLKPDDASFILELLNEPSFLQYIGDKGIRNLEDARQYILDGPIASYEKNGFGLYLVQLKDTATPIGMCGLIKRDALEHVDVGFALLPDFWNQGYAYEAASAVMTQGKDTFQLKRIVAIANVDNHASARLLEKLGMKIERTIKLSEDASEVNLFGPAVNDLTSRSTS